MLLNIIKVRFRNFFCFGNKWQEIEIKPGLNLILGINKDKGFSNGSGKSATLETISFALFGQTHKEIKKEQIPNWKNKKKCEVQLTFKKFDDIYIVKRGISPDIFEIHKNDIPIEKPSHVRDYQSQLEEIMELNYQTFISLIHSNINSSIPVLSMKKPEKRKFLEKVFGLFIYTNINELCNEKLKTISQKLESIKLSRAHNIASMEATKNRIVTLEQNLSSFGISEVELKDAKIALEDIQTGNEDVENKFNDLEKKIKDIEFRCIYHDRLMDKIDGSIKRIKAKNKTVGDNLRNFTNGKIEAKKKIDLIKQAEELYGSVDSIKEQIKDIDEKLMVEENLIKAYEETSLSLNNKIIEINNNLKHIIEKIEAIEGRGECPTCGGPIEALEHGLKNDKIELEKNHEQLLIEFKNSKENGKIHKIKHDQFITTKKSLEIGLRKVELLVASTSQIDLDKLTTDETILSRKSLRYDKVLITLDNIKNKKIKENLKFTKGLSLLTEKKNILKKIILDIGYAKEQVNNSENKIKIQKESKKNMEDIIQSEKASMEVVKNENKIFDETKVKLENLNDYINAIKIICKDENIKQFAISTLLPYLNKQMNKYLSNLGHDFYIILSKWLEPTIKGSGITKGTYNSLSSGEKRGVDLSLQFALLDMARVRAGIWPDIWISDELLDSSIDKQGLHELMKIIKSKHSEEPESKIFIISHRSEIEDEFDNTYLVEKQGGFSTVNCI